MESIKRKIWLAFKNGWKIFLLSLAAQFIVAALLHFGAKSPQALDFLMLPNMKHEAQVLISPLARPDVFEEIKGKLEGKPNHFQLRKQNSLVPSALQPNPVLAGAEYDQARVYLVVDLDTGEVLAEKNGSQKVPMASLTKIMTAIVALDLASPEENFVVSEGAASVQPTSIGVVPGQKMALEELLNALLLTSANDSAQVIKEGIDQKYSQGSFIKAMNAKAQILGLNNTHFENPQGYDGKNHFSSAEDLAVLSQYALKNYPEISEIVKKDYQYLPQDSNHKQFDLYNWNGLLRVYPGVYGVKIGNTSGAGHTMVVVSERENTSHLGGGMSKKVMVVLLGAPGVLERDLWASGLLDLGFDSFGLDRVNVTPDQLQIKYATWKYWG